MKTLYKILILVIALSFSACDFLDVETKGFIPTEKYYEDENDVYMALVGVYNPLASQSFYGRDWFFAFNSQDDLGYYDRNYSTEELFLNNFTYTNTRLNNLWTNLYGGINRANSVLKHIDDVTFKDEDLKKAYIGEVKFLRAYYYFILSSLWEDVPLRKEAVESLDVSSQIAATPKADIFEFVVQEMVEAEQMVYPATSFQNAGRISKSTVQGILARVYLKMAGAPMNLGKAAYAEAAKWAGKVKDSNIHKLNNNPRGYEEIFIDLVQDNYNLTFRESIWEVEFKGNNLDGHETGGCLGSYSGILCQDAVSEDTPGYSYGYITNTLVLEDLYTTEDSIRKNWNIASYYYAYNATTKIRTKVEWRSHQKAYRNAGKFRREYETVFPKSKDYTPINFPVLRYADILLMIAEAENEANSGPSQLAYECLNEVRDRAMPGATPISGKDYEEFKQIVRNERAMELCFEGQRKQDLIRWGTYVTAMTTDRRAMINDSRWIANKAFAANIANYTSTRHVVYPIPSTELATNSLIKQHPLW